MTLLAKNTKPLKVYLIAGEPSGDLLGARLMRAMKTQKETAQVAFYGVGGEAMAQEGLKSLFDISDLAVMGFVEVIPSIPVILRHLDEIIADIKKVQPDIIMTIDSYSFSIRVHKKIKKAGILIPHVHCVAPQVWAWKKGRAKKLGCYVDHLFCLLPQEEKYFTPYGLETTFIGHPVIEGGASKGNGKDFRKRNDIPEDATVLCVLPGSRKNEIKYLLPTFMESAQEISKQVPNLFVVVPTVATVADKVRLALASWNVPHLVVTGENNRYDAFASADVALAASGTVSLELALAGVPHLIAYKVSPLTGYLAKKLLHIRFVNLINLLQNKEIIPELLQENCTVDKVVAVLKDLLQHKKQDVKPALEQLGLSKNMTPSKRMAEKLQEIALFQKKYPKNKTLLNQEQNKTQETDNKSLYLGKKRAIMTPQTTQQNVKKRVKTKGKRSKKQK